MRNRNIDFCCIVFHDFTMETEDDRQWREAIDADKDWQQAQEALLNAFAHAADHSLVSALEGEPLAKAASGLRFTPEA